MRSADRPRRQRLPVLRPAPVGPGRRVLIARRRTTALLAAIAALSLGALAGVGCGDDGDDDVDVSVPEISIESTTTTPTETTQSTPTDPDGGNGGGGNFDPSQEDSETNDKPPEPGSPEEAFEKACEENPAACG